MFTKIPKYRPGDAERFFYKIYIVDINNKIYYLTVSNGIYSSKDVSQPILIFTINIKELVDTVKLFRTKTKSLDYIDVKFDFFSGVERLERPLKLITYDDKQKIIYFPVVTINGQVTQRNILYQLKDGYFYYIGIETGKRKCLCLARP